MNLSIQVESQSVISALQNLTRHVNNMQPVYDDIGAMLVGRITENLGRGITPWGDSFQPLSESYIKAKPRRAGGIPLNDTRQHIYQKITHHSNNDGVEVGLFDNDAEKIGAHHQFGSKPGSRQNIPSRPFLPIINNAADLPYSWEQDIVDIISDYLAQA